MRLKTVLTLAVLLGGLAAGAGVYTIQAQKPAQGAASMVVYKTPTCGCCSIWVEHMRKNGFQVEARDVSHQELNALKAKHNVPASMHSCHTGLIGGYAIEGHIPAAEVRRFLAEKPSVAGLAVPGMPLGSPGMEAPGMKPRPYTVLTFDRQGRTEVYATIQP